MALTATQQQRIDDAQTHVKNANAALTAVSKKLETSRITTHQLHLLDADIRFAETQKKEGIRKIGEEKRQALTTLANDPNAVLQTNGTDNNCLLYAFKHDKRLGINSDAEITKLRQTIFDWYTVMFTVPLTVTDEIRDKFNRDFKSVPLLDASGVATALANLKTQMKVFYDDKVTDDRLLAELTTSKPDRMLEEQDVFMASALFGRSINVVMKDGAEQAVNAAGLLGQPFRNIDATEEPVYVHNNGTSAQLGSHYQGFSPDGKNEYKKISLNEANQRKQLDAIIAKEELGIDQKVATIANGDSTIQTDLVNFRAHVVKLIEVENTLENEMAAATAPPPASKKPIKFTASSPLAAPSIPRPTAPAISDQILVLKEKEAALINAKVDPAFIKTLKELHQKRDEALKEVERLKKDDVKKPAFYQVLYNEVAAIPTATVPVLYKTHVQKLDKAATHETSLFYALGIPPGTRKNKQDPFIQHIKTAQANLDISKYKPSLSAADTTLKKAQDAVEAAQKEHGKQTKILSEGKKLLQKAMALRDKAQIWLEEAEKKVSADLDRLAADDPDQEHKKLTDKVNRLNEMLKNQNDDIAGREGALTKLEPEIVELSKKLDAAKTALSVAEKDTSILEAAVTKFCARMKQLEEQQKNGTGNVRRPLDLQWAAILRQQEIVVVHPDGSTQSFLPRLFTKEDLGGYSKDLNDAQLAELNTSALKAMGVNVSLPGIAPKFYIHYDGTHYREFKDAGKTACKDAAVLNQENETTAKANVRKADVAIEDHLKGIKPPAAAADAKTYSDLLAGRAQGKLPSVAAPAQHAWEKKLAKQDLPTVTAVQDTERDMHRQNIDVLLTLWMQGTRADRAQFANDVRVAGPAMLALHGTTYANPPFDASPMFYCRDLTVSKINPGTTPADDKAQKVFLLELIKQELNAYIALKGNNADSALLKDYQAIIYAIENDLVPMNTDGAGLKDSPASPVKPLIDDIHARVAGKAEHLANVIDKKAYDNAYPGQKDAIREAVHQYRSAHLVAQGQPALPTFDPAKAPVPAVARQLKKESYGVGTDKPSIVFRVKGATVYQLVDAVNDKAHDAALMHDGKRVTAVIDGNRLKLVLMTPDGTQSQLTKNAWSAVGDHVTKLFEGMSNSNVEHNKPRMR